MKRSSGVAALRSASSPLPPRLATTTATSAAGAAASFTVNVAEPPSGTAPGDSAVVAILAVTAAAAAVGVTSSDCAEAVPLPALFTARTLNR